ncbi:response regulator [Roseomonas populi]|uniref:Response regulator n=1 Tax=Roseomonas populi TaxID=3121582 RepID=A0ABT1XBF8_9PROT|nr:response regulator [Roseomonas pecuniae]MCR0984334.1 response regulator [Roseomonas pecuniae]
MNLDPEILAFFLPEWEEAAARLAAAPDETAQRRALDTLGALASGAEIGSLKAALRALEPLPEPFDALATAAALASHARAVVEAGEDRPFSANPAAAPDQPPVRTLVVDDSAMMRRLVRESLSADPAFLVVAEASDGREALARIAEDAPDLIMLDIEMPVLDGLGVLRDWALRGTGAVVVVSSAAVPGGEVAAEARRLGACTVVGKPSGAFSPDLGERQGEAIRRAARKAAGLPAEGAP